MQGISKIDFQSEEFTRAARGELTHCEGSLRRPAPCSHGRKGAALQAILGVSIKRARDLYAGRTRYTREEAALLLEHLGLSAEAMSERWGTAGRAPSSVQPDADRGHMLGHSIALTVWNHAEDEDFVKQCVAEYLLSAEADPSVDLVSVALQAAVDLSFALRSRVAGYRDPIPNAAIVGVDQL